MFVLLPLVYGLSTVAAEGPGVTSDQLDVLSARAKEAKKTCGPVAVWYRLQRGGMNLDLSQVLDQSQLTEEGISLRQLLELSRSFGLTGRVLKGDKSALENVPPLSILVITPAHCVVFEGLEKDGSARIFEPTAGEVMSVPVEELRSVWSGEAVVFQDPSLSWIAFSALAVTSAVLVCGMVLALSWFLKQRASRSSLRNSLQPSVLEKV
jgi:hypothetical protein